MNEAPRTERVVIRPSRAMMVVAGLVTQIGGLVCLVLAFAALPIAHDLHASLRSIISAAIGGVIAAGCGTLIYRGNLVALAIAAGMDIGFGIALARGGSLTASLVHMMPASDVGRAEGVIIGVSIGMFVAAILCVLAVPTALRWRRALTGATPELPRTGETLQGLGPASREVTRPMQRIRRHPAVVVIVAIVLIVGGVIVIMQATGGVDQEPRAGRAAGKREAATSGDGGGVASGADHVAAGTTAPASALDAAVAIDAGDTLPPIADFVTSYHAAITHRDAKALAAVFGDHAFAIGSDAHAVAEGRAPVLALVRHELEGGGSIDPRATVVGHDGEVAWLAEELRVGGHPLVVTWVSGIVDHAWSIAAIQIAVPLANDVAYRQARDGTLAVPDALPDHHDDSPLAAAMRTAFASKPSFVAARSTRADAINLGSAPGERVVGGETIRKLFDRLRATMRLAGGVTVGAFGDHGGWGAANVEFTDTDREGNQVTQTFRVLAAFVREDAGWRIVQTQFSNPQ